MEARALVSRDKTDETSPLLVAVKLGKAHNIPYLLGKMPSDDERGDKEEDDTQSTETGKAEKDSQSEEETKKEEDERAEMLRFAEIINEPLDRKNNKRLLHVAAVKSSAQCVMLQNANHDQTSLCSDPTTVLRPQ